LFYIFAFERIININATGATCCENHQKDNTNGGEKRKEIGTRTIKGVILQYFNMIVR
jgi:hypothetical protein